MSAYVSDFSQENYADVRSYAVSGVPLPTRRDLLNDYLQHELRLAGTGPDTAAAARGYLQAAYSPLANAAWGWEFGVRLDDGAGRPDAGLRLRADVRAALRRRRRAAAREDRWGFAWAPRNALGLATGDFAAQTGALLDRLAAAIRDSALPVGRRRSGRRRVRPAGAERMVRRASCRARRVSDAWRPFNVWAQPALAFVTPPQTVVAGAVSAPIAVQLRIGGLPSAAKDAVAVTL